MEKISYRKYDEVERMAKEFGVQQTDIKRIALSVYHDSTGGHPLDAFDILKHYELEVNKGERTELVFRCYESLYYHQSEYAQAADLAIKEKLGEDKVKKAIEGEYYKISSNDQNLLDAVEFADRAAMVLIANGYSAPTIERVKSLADEAAEKAFRESLTKYSRVNYKTDGVIAAHAITPEKQTQIATEVYDSEIKQNPDYRRLLYIATTYNLGEERISKALEGKYTYELNHDIKAATETAKRMPASRTEEIERNTLLNLLRRGDDAEAIEFIREMASDSAIR